MLRRATGVLLTFFLCLAAVPAGNAAAAARRATQDDGPVLVPPPEDNNPFTDGFHGGVWAGGQYVSLDMFSVESDTYYAPAPDGGWEERVDFYYANSDMSRSEGGPLSYAVYELDRPASHNLLRITLGGTTVTLDFATGQPHPISDADYARLNAWRDSDDARLTRAAGESLIQHGGGDSDDLLAYYAIAMMVDPAEHVPPEQLAAGPRRRSDRPPGDVVTVPAVYAPPAGPAASAFVRHGRPACLPLPLLTAAARPQTQTNCFGCCGAGCYCIPAPFGGAIYAAPCAAHDRCTRQNGSPFHRNCLVSLGQSALFVWGVYRRAIRI